MRRLGHDSRVSEQDPDPPTSLAIDATLEKTRLEQRVDEIIKLQASGVYLPGVTDKQLAARWGCHVTTVHRASAEAHRAVRRSMGENEEIRTRCLQAIESIRVRAMARTRTKTVNGVQVEVPNEDLRAALMAIETFGKFLGLVRTEVRVSRGRDHFDSWSVEELEAYADTGEEPARLRASSRADDSEYYSERDDETTH